ncbi:hypothetical protein A3K42_00825 [candidate division WWE3 bacterium RBG_13_37_7]|uniref:General secretion pathway GspH domain-containing protein n=1 Tax=candidate division WWE3 bacterium RBG_13_37_7 TaxID=1802609 RepID=A0A1F4U0V9_UNCKA|nr:MAG: hypothetical protein A3K42_00825 [candidate division WWE3 bacterium RBG_13_37_7]
MILPKLPTALYNKAFTLIELLISVSVIMILTGISIPSFTSYIRDQELKQALEQIKSDLRTIQNNALAGAGASETIGGDTPEYWGVAFINDSGKDYYRYFISLNNSGCNINDGANVAVKGNPVYLTENVSLINSGSTCVYFDFENGDASGSQYIAIQNNSNASCIKVYTTGLIAPGTWNSGSGGSCE